MTEAAKGSLDMEGKRESLCMESPLRSPKRLKHQHHHLYAHQQAEDQERRHEEEEEEEEEEEGKEEDGKGNVGVATADPGTSMSTSLSLALTHSPQQQQHIKCRLFSTPQGCPFASSCLFSHSPGEDSVSKAMLCTKFFSTSGCPDGNECRFSHYDPKSASSVAVLGSGTVEVEKFLEGTNTLDLGIVPKTMLGEYKSRLCNQFGTLKGCNYGEKCHFAHGEQELRRLEGDVSSDVCIVKSPGAKSPNTSGLGNLGGLVPSNKPRVRYQASPSKTSAAAFGRSSKAMINVDANLAGPIIGRRGMHAKQICRLTGAKLCVREHESDLNLRVVEMEGSFEQVKQAGLLLKQVLFHALKTTPRRSRRSKVCKNFPLGKCAFGNRCHFVHAMVEEPSMAGT